MNADAILCALTLLAIAGWGYAFALALELGKVRGKLQEASKNDARDPKTGRFVRNHA